GNAGWINASRPSRRLLRGLLRMTTVFHAIKNPVILRSAPGINPGARLEGRRVRDAAITRASRKARGGAGPGKGGEALLRRHAVRYRFLGVFVTQFVEAEPTAFRNLDA